MKKLNLGCGTDFKKGYINLDSLNLKGVDITHDLNNFPYPFKKNEFDEIYASHILEHVKMLELVMEELERISKSGGLIEIRVHHFSCGVSYRDPTHRRVFSYFTFDYFTKKCNYNLPQFRILKRKLNFTRNTAQFLNYIFNPLINLNPLLYERFFCWILPCSEVICTLEVIK